MSMLTRYFAAASLVLPLALAAQAAQAQAAANAPRCQMGTREHSIEHVVYLQFDNVHLRRDNPNVPSDLEQIPNLLNFLKDQGTVLTNHHDPLISHTAVDIVTSLTGVYGEKFGFSIGNSFGEFQSNGVAAFTSAFSYWTDPSRDGLPQMVDQRGKIHPAPWVPFTRAGCDVGAFSLANIEFENVTSDVSTVFGPAIASAVAQETTKNGGDDTQVVSQFEGIAIHCAKNSTLCAKAPACPATPVNGQPPTGCTAADLLPDEPGGYNGFNALFGNINVQPIISPKGPVRDLDGNVIANIANDGVTAFPGFPGFDPLPAQALGYVATMLEAGVPVVYFYIADAHDNQNISISGVDPNAVSTFGPGEQGYVNQLAAYNKAFGEFFARLEKDGITKDNTLFVVTADENDHFVGSAPSPAGCDGIHTPCTYANIGEIDGDLSRDINVALPTGAQRAAADPVYAIEAIHDPDLLPGTANAVAADGPSGEEGAGYIWNAAIRAGQSVRNYGFFMDLVRYEAPVTLGGIPPLRDPASTNTQVAFTAEPALLTRTDPERCRDVQPCPLGRHHGRSSLPGHALGP
jgi:hypothetical protein